MRCVFLTLTLLWISGCNAGWYAEGGYQARREGNLELAKEELHQALKMDSKHERSRLLLADIYYTEGRYQRARELLERAPSDKAKLYSLLGKSFHALGQSENALSAFAKAVEQKDALPEDHLTLAKYLDEELGFGEKSVVHYRAYLAKGNGDDAAVTQRIFELTSKAP